MADATYDALVIGGGHHGTIIAAYLAKAGMKVGVFERQRELGGGACGEELPLPGFIQNPCAHFTRFWAHPAYADLKLKDYGLTYVFPDQNEGMVFDDETCFIGYSAWKIADPLTGREEFSSTNANKTFEQIARFSTRDADTAEKLMHKYEKKWRPAFRKYRYTPPTPWGIRDPLEELCDDPEDRIDPVYQFMTVKEIAYDLFESDELRSLFIRGMASSNGCLANDVPGLYGFVHTLGLVLSWESSSIVLGGTHTITHALQRALSALGGQFFVQTEVEKIMVENDRAVGIRLRDGSEIRASQLVVSAAGTPQTMVSLLGEDYISPQVKRRLENIDYDRGQILWGNVVVHELPKYKATSYNADCGQQPRLYWGPKDPDYLATRYDAEIMTRGWSSKLFILSAPDSLWDETRAADGKHTVLVEQFTAPYRLFSDNQWLEMKKRFVDDLVTQWRHYAPNMTKDNVIAAHIMSPYDVVRRNVDMLEGGYTMGRMTASNLGRFRPVPELSGYRTPVKNLYLCSSSQHSGVGIGRGSSYCCFRVIVEDFGLDKIWEKAGRPY